MLKKIILIIASFFLSSSAVFGCLCARPTIHSAHASTDTVMRAKIVSQSRGEHDALLTTMEVQKIYKGTVRPGEKIVFSNKIGKFDFGCVVSFEKEPVGSEWLVFAATRRDRPLRSAFWRSFPYRPAEKNS